MTTLAADTPRQYASAMEPIFNDLPMSVDIVYEGSAVGGTSGYMRPFVVSDEFEGFCQAQSDNSGGSTGDINVNIRSQGVVKLTVVGASAVTNINDLVYATDDATFTLTASGATAIGKVRRWESGTTCWVAFQAVSLRSQVTLD